MMFYKNLFYKRQKTLKTNIMTQSMQRKNMPEEIYDMTQNDVRQISNDQTNDFRVNPIQNDTVNRGLHPDISHPSNQRPQTITDVPSKDVNDQIRAESAYQQDQSSISSSSHDQLTPKRVGLDNHKESTTTGTTSPNSNMIMNDISNHPKAFPHFNEELSQTERAHNLITQKALDQNKNNHYQTLSIPIDFHNKRESHIQQTAPELTHRPKNGNQNQEFNISYANIVHQQPSNASLMANQNYKVRNSMALENNMLNSTLPNINFQDLGQPPNKTPGNTIQVPRAQPNADLTHHVKDIAPIPCSHESAEKNRQNYGFPSNSYMKYQNLPNNNLEVHINGGFTKSNIQPSNIHQNPNLHCNSNNHTRNRSSFTKNKISNNFKKNAPNTWVGKSQIKGPDKNRESMLDSSQNELSRISTELTNKTNELFHFESDIYDNPFESENCDSFFDNSPRETETFYKDPFYGEDPFGHQSSNGTEKGTQADNKNAPSDSMFENFTEKGLQAISQMNKQLDYQEQHSQQLKNVKNKSAMHTHANHVAPNPLTISGLNNHSTVNSIRKYNNLNYNNLGFNSNLQSNGNALLALNPWLNKKKRKNNPLLWQYIKQNNNVGNSFIMHPSKYSSLDFVCPNGKKSTSEHKSDSNGGMSEGNIIGGGMPQNTGSEPNPASLNHKGGLNYPQSQNFSQKANTGNNFHQMSQIPNIRPTSIEMNQDNLNVNIPINEPLHETNNNFSYNEFNQNIVSNVPLQFEQYHRRTVNNQNNLKHNNHTFNAPPGKPKGNETLAENIGNVNFNKMGYRPTHNEQSRQLIQNNSDYSQIIIPNRPASTNFNVSSVSDHQRNITPLPNKNISSNLNQNSATISDQNFTSQHPHFSNNLSGHPNQALNQSHIHNINKNMNSLIGRNVPLNVIYDPRINAQGNDSFIAFNQNHLNNIGKKRRNMGYPLSNNRSRNVSRQMNHLNASYGRLHSNKNTTSQMKQHSHLSSFNGHIQTNHIANQVQNTHDIATSQLTPTQNSLNSNKLYLGKIKMNDNSKRVNNNSVLPLYIANFQSCLSDMGSKKFSFRKDFNHNDKSIYRGANDQKDNTICPDIEFKAISASFMTDTNIDYENVTVFQLKMLAKEYGLNHTGKKNELIDRIRETRRYIHRMWNFPN